MYLFDESIPAVPLSQDSIHGECFSLVEGVWGQVEGWGWSRLEGGQLSDWSKCAV